MQVHGLAGFFHVRSLRHGTDRPHPSPDGPVPVPQLCALTKLVFIFPLTFNAFRSLSL